MHFGRAIGVVPILNTDKQVNSRTMGESSEAVYFEKPKYHGIDRLAKKTCEERKLSTGDAATDR